MDTDTYPARREARRRRNAWTLAAMLVALSGAQVGRAGLVPVGLFLLGSAAALGAVAVAVRVRQSRTALSCPAQVPLWVLDDGATGRPTSAGGEGELLGTLQFSPGSLDWLPGRWARRSGAVPVHWDVVDRAQLRAEPIWGLTPQLHLRILVPRGTVACSDLWLRVSEQRLDQLLTVTLRPVEW
jgi:hypothetical protein